MDKGAPSIEVATLKDMKRVLESMFPKGVEVQGIKLPKKDYVDLREK